LDIQKHSSAAYLHHVETQNIASLFTSHRDAKYCVSTTENPLPMVLKLHLKKF